MTDIFVSTKMMYNLPIAMRDGVRLMCDVIRPDTDEPLPTVLVRTAYLKEPVYSGERGVWLLNALDVARRGYNFVVQDARGTGSSEGVCDPSGHQAEDGYDTVEAIAAMPWSNGQVGMVGESFLGYVCLEAARLKPPHLTCIVPCECGWLKNPYFHCYGVPVVGSHGWCYGRALDRDTRRHDMTQETKDRIAYMNAHNSEMMTHLPTCSMPQDDVPGVAGLDKGRAFLEHLGDDEYLKELGRDDAHSEITVPVMHVTGWVDPELNTTVYNYVHFRKNGGSELTRNNMKMIIGPWPHGALLPRKYAGVDFGPEGSGRDYGVDERIMDFLDYWMRGRESEFMSGPSVHSFVMGRHSWRTVSSWPPEEATETAFYLRSGGNANTLHGDGILSETAPGAEEPDHYTYDPGDPIPTIPRNTENARFADMSPIEERKDILVYTTAPFETPRTFMGMVRFRFYAASSAVDTDFAGKLLLVYPDGRAVEIYATLMRARYRRGRKPEFLTPGQVYEYEMDLTNISLCVEKGFALRLEVCSCLFPIADRNMNTGGRIGFESEYLIAEQTLFHDDRHPSCLLLPEMKEEQANDGQ